MHLFHVNHFFFTFFTVTILDPSTSPPFSTHQCLVTCGKGIRHRQVSCRMGNGEEKLSEHFCDPSSKPPTVGNCELPECASWQVGAWGAVRPTNAHTHTSAHTDKTEKHWVRTDLMQCLTEEMGFMCSLLSRIFTRICYSFCVCVCARVCGQIERMQCVGVTVYISSLCVCVCVCVNVT